MRHPTKTAVLDLASVVIWININPRTINCRTDEQIHSTLFDPNLLSSLLEKGQLHEIRVLKGDQKYEKIGAGDSTKFYVLQGNTRVYTMQAANRQAEKDGRKIPFPNVRAFVYEDLDTDEITDVVHDHGARDLTRAQAYLAYEQEKLTGASVLEIVSGIRPMLEKCGFKPIDTDRDVNPLTKFGRTEYAKVRKGVTDVWDKAFEGPRVLRDAYVERLEKNKIAPRDSEVRKLSDIYQKEQETENPKGTINRSNPGPKFLAAWNEYLRAQAEAEAAGAKPKSTSMLNRDNFETIQKQAESRIIKAMSKIARRMDGWTEADVPALDKIAVAYESGDKDLGLKLMDELWQSKVTVTSAVAA